ncbi:unnamed protein product, partial [Musa textilis]
HTFACVCVLAVLPPDTGGCNHLSSGATACLGWYYRLTPVVATTCQAVPPLAWGGTTAWVRSTGGATAWPAGC